ncbi:hypothetical protein KTE71_30370 [Burkholderia multivorans]|uniref:hypothetical protein n=1 Tax=Burkholderia multivorans TaxID=87883 RepID=UPI001C27C6D1|nr:hypothetical protein [Burkholderia multivorans]MBU9391801.1 hypothetical protein [Burkholderia multivorans]
MQPEFDPRFTVTLDALRKAGACYEGYNKLVRSLHGQPFTEEDEDRNSYIHFKHDAEIPLLDILKSNGLDDALWALRCVSGADRDLRLFAVWCARQVEHLMEDQRSKDALNVAERFANGDASDEELAAARDAARAAAWDAAWAAAWAAARAAARDAAGDAAWAAARDAQTEMFKRMCLGTAPWQQGKVAA